MYVLGLINFNFIYVVKQYLFMTAVDVKNDNYVVPKVFRIFSIFFLCTTDICFKIQLSFIVILHEDCYSGFEFY